MKVSENVKLTITSLSSMFFGGLAFYCLAQAKVLHSMSLLLVMVFMDIILDRFLLNSQYTRKVKA